MEIGTKLLLCLSLAVALTGPRAFGEPGPRLEGLQSLPPLPGSEDPSEMLDDETGVLSKALMPAKPREAASAPAQSPAPKTEEKTAETNALVPVQRKPGSELTLPGASVLNPTSPAARPAPVLAAPPGTAPAPASPAPAAAKPEGTKVSITTDAPAAAVNRAPSNTVVEKKIPLEDPTSVRGPEFAILLTDGRFRPARVRLKAGETSKILFTTLGPKPAALIIERLRVQRWLTRPEEATKRTPASLAAPWEINRELSANRLTEIAIEPVKGNYTFHDAISGAAGEIIVE